jgi:DNA primase
MTNQSNLAELGGKFHKNLPDRIREYLHGRGIPDESIDLNLLGWNGWRINIPIFDRDGKLAFFKQAKDPEDKNDGPKMIAWPKGHLELYGWENLKGEPSQIIICEGEFDRLVLEANGFKAVTATGGARAFKKDWVKEFESIPEVYICYDNDKAGKAGALRVGRLISHAKIVELPSEIGDGGDVTDYFVRLGQSRDDFLKLLQEAKPAPPPEPEIRRYPLRTPKLDSASRDRVERVKNENPIAQVIGRYVELRPSGHNLVGLCPFHEDHVPSFTVYQNTGKFHCYGCGKHGDVISFLRYKDGLSFSQALDALDRYSSPHGGKSQ